jgi:hypothetical protein
MHTAYANKLRDIILGAMAKGEDKPEKARTDKHVEKKDK